MLIGEQTVVLLEIHRATNMPVKFKDIEYIRIDSYKKNLKDDPAYFELLSMDLPENKNGIIESLKNDGMIAKCETGGYNITNLGAVLFAKKLSDFLFLSRKSIRVIVYNGKNKTVTSYEYIASRVMLQGLMD